MEKRRRNNQSSQVAFKKEKLTNELLVQINLVGPEKVRNKNCNLNSIVFKYFN